MPKYQTEEKQLYKASFFHQIFQVQIDLIWCEDDERILRLLNLNDDKGVLKIPKKGAATYFLHVNGNLNPAIAFPFVWKPGCPQLTSLLAHECIHAITCLFRYKEVPLPKDIHYNNNDEENFCYTHQWLFQECLYALNEQEKYCVAFSNEELIKK